MQNVLFSNIELFPPDNMKPSSVFKVTRKIRTETVLNVKCLSFVRHYQGGSHIFIIYIRALTPATYAIEFKVQEGLK